MWWVFFCCGGFFFNVVVVLLVIICHNLFVINMTNFDFSKMAWLNRLYFEIIRQLKFLKNGSQSELLVKISQLNYKLNHGRGIVCCCFRS